MNPYLPIQRCPDCGRLFWAGLQVIGLIATHEAVGTRYERKTLAIGIVRHPGSAIHCTPKSPN